MRGEEIRALLHAGERVYGTHICSLANPVHAQMLTTLELDFVFICNEHMPIDRTETAMMCRFWAAQGIAPIVRVPSPDATQAAMAIDGGAHGVCAPYVETPEQVRAMVGAVRYRPIKGQYLDELLAGSRQPTAEQATFLSRFNRDTFLVIGIESVPAIDRLEELITIDGVDAVFLGPHDITVSMGIPEQYGHPDFVATIVDICRRCRAHNVGVGLHYALTLLPPEHLQQFWDAGMNYIANEADVTTIVREMNRQFAHLRGLAGDTYRRGAAAGMVAGCAASTSQPAEDHDGSKRT